MTERFVVHGDMTDKIFAMHRLFLLPNQ